MVSSAASLKRAGLLSLPLPVLGAAFTMSGPCLFLERQVYAVARDDQGSQVSIASGWKILQR